MLKIKIKPLSINDAFQGRRFKTDKYKQYEYDCFYLLPKKIEIPKKKKKELIIIAGISSKNADIDNISKCFIDILQKKYKFNDKEIYKLSLTKIDVKKGEEYIDFSFI